MQNILKPTSIQNDSVTYQTYMNKAFHSIETTRKTKTHKFIDFKISQQTEPFSSTSFA